MTSLIIMTFCLSLVALFVSAVAMCTRQRSEEWDRIISIEQKWKMLKGTFFQYLFMAFLLYAAITVVYGLFWAVGEVVQLDFSSIDRALRDALE